MRRMHMFMFGGVALLAGLASLQLVKAGGEVRSTGSRSTAASPQADPQASLACYERARKRSMMGEGNAFLLCRGASSSGPVDCYDAGREQTPLGNAQLFDLCRCASDATPVACYERAKRETFLLDQQIIQLCSAIVTHNLWLNCAPIR